MIFADRGQPGKSNAGLWSVGRLGDWLTYRVGGILIRGELS